jgi:hypothetical protein
MLACERTSTISLNPFEETTYANRAEVELGKTTRGCPCRKGVDATYLSVRSYGFWVDVPRCPNSACQKTEQPDDRARGIKLRSVHNIWLPQNSCRRLCCQNGIFGEAVSRKRLVCPRGQSRKSLRKNDLRRLRVSGTSVAKQRHLSWPACHFALSVRVQGMLTT